MKNSASSSFFGATASALGVLASLAASLIPAQASVVDFEDLTLPPESYVNGGPTTNNDGFTSRGTAFDNNYYSDFGGYWEGFSYSNTSDTTTPGFGNQYSAITGSGVGGSGIYGVAFPAYQGAPARITLPLGQNTAQSIQITNTTYAYLSMRDGDGFAKKFGGASGEDPDFFLLTISGFDAANGLLGTVDFYLADFRFADRRLDYIVDGWNLVDLSSLGDSVASLELGWTSTDTTGRFINTPTYAAIDNLVVVPEPSSLVLIGLGLGLVGIRRLRS